MNMLFKYVNVQIYYDRGENEKAIENNKFRDPVRSPL